MLEPGTIFIWLIRLDQLSLDSLPNPSAEEQSRAASFHSPADRDRYLRAHRALRAVLSRAAGMRVEFAVTERGKPYLPAVPDLKFSLSHSREMALIAAALQADVGADIEFIRPMPECLTIAGRFFPATEAAALAATPPDARERDFFRRWTRIEARLKALGVGLYGAGEEIEGEWTLEEIAMPEGSDYAAAVACTRPGMRITWEEL